MKKNKIRQLIISLAVVLIFVLISMILTKNSMSFYDELIQPKLAPPAWLFPVVWTILYAILAWTLYKTYGNKKAWIAIILNLLVNVLWPFWFFRLQLLNFSMYWLIFLIVCTVYMLYVLYDEYKSLMYANLPYLLWLGFALYLNISIYLLNRS